MKQKFSFLVLIILFTQQGFTQIDNKNTSPLSLNSQSKLVVELKPLIDEMGKRNIVGLGEGTHGTKEFNDIRITIIKELITKKGFNIICFESPYGDSYYLNRLINTSSKIAGGLKKYMTSIWQTREVEGLLNWIRKYNKIHQQKIIFTGMDYNYIANAAKILKETLTSNPNLAAKAIELCTHAFYQDSLWDKQNDTTLQMNMDEVFKNGYEGYNCVLYIDSVLKATNTTYPDYVNNALLNCHHGFDMLYHGFLKTDGSPRDKLMAEIVTKLAGQNKKGKTIVWAHAGHIGLKPALEGGNGGGMGGLIKAFPGNLYYALGTTTANGTVSVMTDAVDTRSNKFYTCILKEPIQNSWEHLLLKNKYPAFFIELDKKPFLPEKLKWRILGYLKNSYDYSPETSLTDFFDGLIFIRNTSASNHSL